MAEHVISRITLPNQDVCIIKDSGAARSEHSHDISITTTTGVATTNLSLNTQYQITAGGSNLTFKTPLAVTNIATGSGLTGGPITTTGTISIATGGVSNDMLAGSIDKSKLLQNTISIGGISIPLGGSVSLTDLGLDSAMHYRGVVSAIPPASGTYISGDVVILQNTIKEYIYDGTNWRELGTEGSYKIKQTAYSDSTGTSENATATRFIYSISQDADGVVSAKTRSLPAYISKAGDTINGDLYFQESKQVIFKHDGSTGLSVNPFQVSVGLNGFNGSGSNYTPRLKITPTSLIQGIATPTDNDQAANKLYVDNKFNSGLTAITWDSGNKAITKTVNNSTANIMTFIAGNNISLAAETNKLTINNTYSYSLPLAANGTRGGVQIGYTTSNKNYAVQLDENEKMYVSVPWTDTQIEIIHL